MHHVNSLKSLTIESTDADKASDKVPLTTRSRGTDLPQLDQEQLTCNNDDTLEDFR